MVYKSINGFAPRYMSNLLTRNSACSSRSLQNTKIDLRLPKKHLQMGRNVSRIEVQNCGTASQPRLNRHPPLLRSNRIFNGLGDFSCGRVTGCDPRSLCSIAAEQAIEICFGSPLSDWRGRARGRGLLRFLGRWRNFPVYWFLMYISFTLVNLGFTF